MATPARNPSPWSLEGSSIYAPGVFESDIVTVSPSGEITSVEIKRCPRRALGVTTFGHPSTSFSYEGTRLAEYFEKNVVRSLQSLADPYGIATGADPFEYRSVPYREGRTIKAKLKWVGSIPPSPINDD
jgi:hypothetical protein